MRIAASKSVTRCWQQWRLASTFPGLERGDGAFTDGADLGVGEVEPHASEWAGVAKDQPSRLYQASQGITMRTK
jgi:hypothetical protein